MSASTVSITANTAAAARRRPVVSGERKSNLDFAPNEALQNTAGGDNAAFAAGEINSARVEAAVEKSPRDLIPAVKKPPNGVAMGNDGTISQRRTRKAVGKPETRRAVVRPEKPRWKRALRVFVKNFLALLLLGGLFQVIRKAVLNSDNSPNLGTQMGLSDIEGRIAEAEGFVKTTAKMMQVQMEVLDRKIEGEVGGLRKEMQEKIDDATGKFNTELKKMEDRNERLEKALDDLNAKDWLSKEEFEKFYDEMKKGKAGPFGVNDINLDSLRAYARETVEKEIEKHAADGLGRVDYALASGGAVVVKHSEPYIVGKGDSWFSMNSRSRVHSGADKMLKPSFGEPGQCFPLKGSMGFVQIRLRTAIIPEAITLEHVAKSVAYDRSSAPKDCRISGWFQEGDTDASVEKDKILLLTDFAYDLDKTNAQTFEVSDAARSGLVNMVRLDFTSNHGSSSHTCIYRLRVHGHEPNPVPIVAAAAPQN